MASREGGPECAAATSSLGPGVSMPACMHTYIHAPAQRAALARACLLCVSVCQRETERESVRALTRTHSHAHTAQVFVNQERVLSSLRAEAQARVAATLGSAIGEAGPRCKWSEHPLTAAGLTGPLAPLALDALHLHALCLSLQAAAAAGGGGDVVGR